MVEASQPEKTIFIGGAPRSGASVVHALLCTSPDCNAYHPETGFVRPVFEAYSIGLTQWKGQTARFFQTPEHLKLHMRKLAQQSMSHIWRVLKQPRVLCVKDPLLSRNFPAVNAVLGWPCQFVTILRHPHDVIRVQQQVEIRAGRTMDVLDVYRMAEEYMQSHAHVDAPGLKDRVFQFRYEDLGNDWLTDQLRNFTGLGGINPDDVWDMGTHPADGADMAGPFQSPRFQRPADNLHQPEPLEPAFQKVVNSLCAPLMDRCGYHPDGTSDRW